MDLAQHGWVSLLWRCGCLCLCPSFLLLVAWAALHCWRSISSKCRQVSPWSRRGGRRSDAQDPGDGQWVSGCRGPGEFLCYDLSCRPCSEAARERQRRLGAAAWQSPWASSSPRPPSSAGSSLQQGCSKRRRLLPRRRGLPQRGPVAPEPLAPATAPTDLELAGPTRTLPKRAINHQAGSPSAPGSRTADGAGSLPGDTDRRPMSRLELEHDSKRRLRMHMLKKCIEIRLGSFPAVVQRSCKVSVCSRVRPVAPVTLHSTTAPKYFHTSEAQFLPEEARETLELHIREKRLQQQWSLSRESLGAHVPQAPVSAPRQHPEETHVQLPAQHPPCLPPATEHHVEPQPEPFPPERDDNSGQEGKKQQGSDTDGRMWRLSDSRGAAIYMGRRLSPSPSVMRRAVLKVLGLHRLSKGSFD